MKKITFVFAVVFIFSALFYQAIESIRFGAWCVPLSYLPFSKAFIMLLTVLFIRRFVKWHFGFLLTNYARLTRPLSFLYLALACLALFFSTHNAFLIFLSHLPLFLVFVPVIEISLYVRRMVVISGKYVGG